VRVADVVRQRRSFGPLDRVEQREHNVEEVHDIVWNRWKGMAFGAAEILHSSAHERMSTRSSQES
jgi:hypothetical protein